MDTTELKQLLEQAGFQLQPILEESLQDLPFSEDDMAIMTEVGFPVAAAPGPILFAQGVHPEEGAVLRRLSDEFAQFSTISMAKMIWVFARDGAGNVFWIHTMSGHQITMKDEAHNTNRYVNDSLSSFMQSLLVFRQFQLKYADAETQDAKAIMAAAGVDAVATLKAALETIDAEAFSDEDNFWNFTINSHA